MAYKALYRKYRPSTFDEVVGQQHIVKTLLNAIKSDKLAHAYLFCGPRGTGKTTIAKILAKTINCQSEGHKPCCNCPSCIDIQNSNHPDVVELDAASNNGVDEVRSLIDTIKYAPLNGKYKVYIIDEVHMMTTSAFNALLKTLEEPPEYCIFILATTDPQKVLPTIISRCQRFDFKKIAKPVLKGNIIQICDKESIKISEDAADLIADLAEGGMRDALSILDQCIAYAQNDIKIEDVEMVYGVASTREKVKLFELVSQKNSAGLVEKVKKFASDGIDIKRLTNDLINIAKDAVVYGYCKDASVLSSTDGETANKLLTLFTSTKLLRFIDYLIEAQTNYKSATNALTYFEVCVLKMMNFEEGTREIVQVTPVIEQKTETKKVEEVKVAPVVKEEVKKPLVYKQYSEEDLYQILLASNKQIKATDSRIIANLPFEGDQHTNRLVSIVRDSMIFASSQNNIIFLVNDRETANLLNEEENNANISKVIEQFLHNNKSIYAITLDEKDYIVDYFRENQNRKKEEPTPVVVEEEPKQQEDEALSKLIDAFGEDGFDIVGE